MPKKFFLIARIILILPLSIGIALYISPAPQTLAQTSSCSLSISSPSIKMEGEGFLSVADPSVANNFSFITSTPAPNMGDQGRYICGNNAVIPEFSVLHYQDLVAQYFTAANSLSKATISENPPGTPVTQDKLNLSGSGPTKLYRVEGNLEISSNLNIAQTAVIFVDHNLFINGNIASGSTTGVIFVVGGNVWIDENVTNVDAFIIVHNHFCSASSGDFTNGFTCTPGTQVPSLTINGSVIFMDNPTDDAGNPINPLPGKPEFVRTNSNGNNQPAEVINYQPKYLVIARGVFARTRVVWTEITNQAFPAYITPYSAIPTPTPLPSCYLCDGGYLRKDGVQADCNGLTNVCPTLYGPQNLCISSTDVTGQSCTPPTPTPIPSCDTTSSCSPVSYTYNSCSTNNGSQTCTYTSYTLGGSCTPSSYTQYSTANQCISGYECNAGVCKADQWVYIGSWTVGCNTYIPLPSRPAHMMKFQMTGGGGSDNYISFYCCGSNGASIQANGTWYAVTNQPGGLGVGSWEQTADFGLQTTDYLYFSVGCNDGETMNAAAYLYGPLP